MPGQQRRGTGPAGGGERTERGDRRDNRGGRDNRDSRDDKNQYVERVVTINRVAKGVEEAKKNFFKVPRIQGTIPHPVQGEAAAGVVMLRPAAPGTGVIAGGPVRAVLECAGVHDVLSKSLGSDNAINIVHATVEALRNLEQPEAVAARRGLPLEDVAPAALLRARAAGVGA